MIIISNGLNLMSRISLGILFLLFISNSASANYPCAELETFVFKDMYQSSAEKVIGCLKSNEVCGVTMSELSPKPFKVHPASLKSTENIVVDSVILNDVKNNVCVLQYQNGGASSSCSIDVINNKKFESTINCEQLELANTALSMSKYFNSRSIEIEIAARPCKVNCGFGAEGLFLGFMRKMKAGGSFSHDELNENLLELAKGTSYKVSCVKGPAADKPEKYFDKRPQPEKIKCQGSFGVFIGPFNSMGKAEQFIEDATLGWSFPFATFRCKESKCTYKQFF